jgi:hypothetical protein
MMLRIEPIPCQFTSLHIAATSSRMGVHVDAGLPRPVAQVLQRQDLVPAVRALVTGGQVDEPGPKLVRGPPVARQVSRLPERRAPVEQPP